MARFVRAIVDRPVSVHESVNGSPTQLFAQRRDAVHARGRCAVHEEPILARLGPGSDENHASQIANSLGQLR